MTEIRGQMTEIRGQMTEVFEFGLRRAPFDVLGACLRHERRPHITQSTKSQNFILLQHIQQIFCLSKFHHQDTKTTINQASTKCVLVIC
ncbi:hypothetical protein D1BOALGB6SA_7341 [Olavius sp. associated proteobacterium Delta 1]|nr:hypothetical protein D1BOALGB6SA_7341 [Olavius sp. associated proteobacterium Delta 1]